MALSRSLRPPMPPSAASGTAPDGGGAANAATGASRPGAAWWRPGVRGPDGTPGRPSVGEGANAMPALDGRVMDHRLADLPDWRADQAFAAWRKSRVHTYISA